MPIDQSKDSILAKVRALMARTVENGATEAEALNAAAKAADLLDKHGLSMKAVDFKQDKGTLARVRVHDHPIRRVASAIAHFCDCRVWISNGEELVFLGHSDDAEFAEQLTDHLYNAMEYEWLIACFNNPKLTQGRGRTRLGNRNDFLFAMAARLNERLYQLKEERHQVSSDGTALVPYKAAQVEEWFKAMGVRLGAAKQGRKARVTEASIAGWEAGGRVSLNGEIEG
jgi:hypothetical protein